MNARRMNSASVAGGDGGKFRLASFSLTSSSMKFRFGPFANVSAGRSFAYGETTRPMAILLRYHAVIALSPWPITLTFPVGSSMVATDVSDTVYFVQRVTSCV